MPEASSALFMSQFTDEAVRDAIARVSSSYSVHVAPTTGPAILVRWLRGESGRYLQWLKICLFRRCCVLRIEGGSEEIFFLEYNLRFQSPRPSHPDPKLKAWDIYCFNFTSRCFFPPTLIPAIVTCHLTFDTRLWNAVGGWMALCHVS